MDKGNFFRGCLDGGRDGGRRCSEGYSVGVEGRATVRKGSRGVSVGNLFAGGLKRVLVNVLLFFPCVLVFNDAHPVTGEWYWGYNVLGVLYSYGYCRWLRR